MIASITAWISPGNTARSPLKNAWPPRRGWKTRSPLSWNSGVKTTPSGPMTVSRSSRETLMSRIPALTVPSAPMICSIREAGRLPPLTCGAARAAEARMPVLPRMALPSIPLPSASARRRLSRLTTLGSTVI